jgi:hypothetical protein
MSRIRAFLSVLLIVGCCQLIFSDVAFAKKKTNRSAQQEYLYQQKVLRKIEKDKYKESLLPFSGYMTKEEYERKTQDVQTSSMSIPEPKLPKDIKMKYVPQPTYKLTGYNRPAGTVELRMDRSLRFDRQENGLGVTSPDKSIMVYPAIYYYASSKTTSCDLFVVPLDKSLPEVDRLLRANVVRRNPVPILSTDKSIDEDYSFRTLTPIDFSPDGLRFIAKEKIGYSYDGIWQTNLWVYDFETKGAKNLVEIRDAIKFYWLETKGIRLDEKRWDIFPLGFDAEDPARIIVTAYAFTGEIPRFLGTWSVDYKGERTQLISLFDSTANVSVNGFKLIKSGVVNPSEVFANEKEQDKIIKAKRRAEKKAKREKAKLAKAAFNKKIKEMKKEAIETSKLYKKQNSFGVPITVD